MKYVIFDIDGTLTNTKKVDDKCFKKAFEKTFNIDIWNQKWESLTHVTDWGITEELVEQSLNRRPYDSEYELMISTFIDNLNKEKEHNSNQFNEIPGSRSFFNLLRNNPNYQLGIATGSWEESAKIKLDSIRIDLTEISFSNGNYFKSREEITKDVIQQLKVKAGADPEEEIIYFGDGEWDYKTCINLGIRFIGIDVLGDGKLRSLGVKTVFNDFQNTEDVINELHSNA